MRKHGAHHVVDLPPSEGDPLHSPIVLLQDVEMLFFIVKSYKQFHAGIVMDPIDKEIFKVRHKRDCSQNARCGQDHYDMQEQL
jgi:hypothetical protein